jgi:hypothetical protein
MGGGGEGEGEGLGATWPTMIQDGDIFYSMACIYHRLQLHSTYIS